MFGNLVQRLQESFSPVTSPINSPKALRRRFKSPTRGPHAPRAAPPPSARVRGRVRRNLKEEYREVQSEPEDNPVRSASQKLLDKRKSKSRPQLDISSPLPVSETRSCYVSVPNIYERAICYEGPIGLPLIPPTPLPRTRASRVDRHLNRESAVYWNSSQGFYPLQGSKSLGRLEGSKEIERLARYEEYLQQLLTQERENQEEVARNRIKAKENGVKREPSDLERIQDLFPSDNLRLYENDVVTMRIKGLIRKRTTRLQRALSAKRSECEETKTPVREQVKRVFLMETSVQFTSGVQSQERHLFLFNDLLLIAKARSGGNFKLKDQVRVSELWLTRNNMEEVTEVPKSPETSFVLGWPTTNVVASFNTQATRDLWWNKLNEVIATEREKEPLSTNIQVRFFDSTTNIEYVKTFSVGPHDTASRCICMALQHLEMRGLDPKEFQLWAKTSRDEAPYPLIGHERPFSIKLSCLRQGLNTEEGFDLDHCNNVHGPDPYTRCQFILRNTRRISERADEEPKKSRKKNRKSPMRIRQVFRRSLHKEDGESPTPGVLFSQPLSRVFDGEMPPRPVMAMFHQVFQKGPFTQGIFRKSANARLVREIREKIDSGADVAFENVPVLVTAALLKDFLRSLPSPLLGANLYSMWIEALGSNSTQERLTRLRTLVGQLPSQNQTLLAFFLCVLHHIVRKSSHNLMTAGNLGVCVGPSLLWAPCLTPAATKAVPALVEVLILHCDVIIGPHVRHLLGEPPERLQDSGAEESDSLHSGGLRRDDSSIDSLERELSEPPRKDKMSLSRDSGLTMSDSQLYTPDEEESTSSSSSGSGKLYVNTPCNRPQSLHPHNKVSASYSMPASNSTPMNGVCLAPSALTGPGPEYVRVYGGWEERVQGCYRATVYAPTPVNPHFQRQDWFRQRSGLRRSGPRSSSQESLKLDCDPSKRPALHRKGPAPAPPVSQSTPHIDGDRFYDSSTISDDDSTPHVSRSNSRGKDDDRLVHAAPACATLDPPPLPPKRVPLRHLPPVHVDDVQDENKPPERRGRLRRRELVYKAMAHRSKSLPPAEETEIYSRLGDVTRTASDKARSKMGVLETPPPYRPPPAAAPCRVLGDHQEESYV